MPMQRFVDLSADDLVVVEDGVEQKIDAFHEPVGARGPSCSALDESGSMRRSAAAVVEAAHEFVDALRPEDSLAPMLFADQVFFEHDLTKDREAARKAIDGISGQRRHGTLRRAVGRSRSIEARRRAARDVVILTDGRDENNPGTGPGSVRNLDDVLALAKETDAAIHSIGLGTKVDKAPLERLALLSGGRDVFPGRCRRDSGSASPHRREPAPALRCELHVDQHRERRRVARCTDSAAVAGYRRHEPRRGISRRNTSVGMSSLFER